MTRYTVCPIIHMGRLDSISEDLWRQETEMNECMNVCVCVCVWFHTDEMRAQSGPRLKLVDNIISLWDHLLIDVCAPRTNIDIINSKVGSWKTPWINNNELVEWVVEMWYIILYTIYDRNTTRGQVLWQKLARNPKNLVRRSSLSSSSSLDVFHQFIIYCRLPFVLVVVECFTKKRFESVQRIQ